MNEPFPDYPSLADAIEDGERVTVRWGHDKVRNLSAGQVAAIVAALRSSVAASERPRVRGPLKLDTDSQVFFYEQDHYYLSNFSAFTVLWHGRIFQTSEHAYHWSRFVLPEDRAEIMGALSAHDAFIYAQGHKANQVKGWDTIKFDTMRDILRAKAAQHEYVRRKLIQTGDRELIENSWRDPVWGWGENRDGQNMLGKLWMEVRAEIRASSRGERSGE